MYDQIMSTQYSLIAGNFIGNIFYQLRRRSLAQQWIHGVSNKTYAAVDNKNSHSQAHPSVQIDAGKMGHHRGQQYSRGCDGIVAAVGAYRLQRGRAYALPHTTVENGHPYLQQYRSRQYRKAPKAKGNRGGADDLGQAALAQLNTDHQYHNRHGQSRYIFKPPVPERVFLVRGSGGNLKAHQGDHRTGGVRQIVQAVRNDGNTAGNGTYGQLARNQQKIAYNSHQAR